MLNSTYGRSSCNAFTSTWQYVHAQYSLDRRALVADGAVGLEDRDDVRGVLDEGAETLLALPEFLLRLLALGHRALKLLPPGTSSRRQILGFFPTNRLPAAVYGSNSLDATKAVAQYDYSINYRP